MESSLSLDAHKGQSDFLEEGYALFIEIKAVFEDFLELYVFVFWAIAELD